MANPVKMDQPELDRDNTSDVALSRRDSRAPSPSTWQDHTSGKIVQTHGLQTGAPNLEGMEVEGLKQMPRPSRYRPRTFPYQKYLPYAHKDEPMVALAEIMKRLYIAVSAGDFVPGATHWTRELRAWIQLKFDLPRDDRVKLVKLYYELALAPGMDSSASERFSSMFMTLTR